MAIVETAATLNPAVEEMNRVAVQISKEISAAQQAVVPATPVLLAPTLTPTDDSELTSALPADAARVLQKTQETAATISGELEALSGISKEQADAHSIAIVEGIGAAQKIALQVDTAKLQAQDQTRKVHKALGGNAAQVRRAEEQYANEIEMGNLIDERADIMDDVHSRIALIDKVVNEFRAIGVNQDIKDVVADQRQVVSSIREATTTVQSASQTNLLVAETVTMGTIAANQQLIAAEGNAELYKVQLQQNQTSAANLRTMLAASDNEMKVIMQGYDLLNSVENRQLQRETMQLRREENERAAVLSRVTLRLALIKEQRETLQLRVDAGTADAKVRAQLKALEEQDLRLRRQGIAANIDEATEQKQIDAAGVALEQAQSNLEASNLALKREKEPTRRAALQAQNEAQITAAASAEFVFDELKAGQAVRVAGRQGALDAQGQQATLTDLQIQAATGKLSSILALAREQERQITAAEAIRLANAQNVQGIQSFMYGEQAVETMDEIDDRIQSNDPFYLMMRQLGSVKGPQGEFVLAAPDQYSLANERLKDFEAHGEVPSSINGVQIIREVRKLQQKEQEKGSLQIPVDEAAEAIQFNVLMKDYLKDINAEIRFGDNNNPLQPGNIKQLTALSGEDGNFANQPLTKVLNRAGQEDTNMDPILERAIVDMQANGLTFNETVDGILSLGGIIAINNSVAGSGLALIGAPYQVAVNMTVRKPRGFVTSFLDTALSNLAQADLTTTAAIPSLAAAGVEAGARITAAFAEEFSTSDFITLNINDRVAITQHLIAIMSSTTLGGAATPASLTGGEE